MENLENIAEKIVEKGKGILAADESTNTIKKRFDSINTVSTELSRCDYRETLFSTTNISNFISGVILFEETFFQKNKNNESLKEKLENVNCYPGIKIDQGLEPINKDKIEEAFKILSKKINCFIGCIRYGLINWINICQIIQFNITYKPTKNSWVWLITIKIYIRKFTSQRYG